MARRILLLLLLVHLSIATHSQSSLKGTVVGTNKQPIGNALIAIYLGGQGIDSVLSEADGTYWFLKLKQGTYDLRVSYAGFTTVNKFKFQVAKKSTQVLDFVLTAAVSLGKDGIVVRQSRVNIPPLINAKNPNTHAIASERLEKMASIDLNDGVSLSSNSYQSKNGASVQLGGARAASTQYIIDGVVYNGSGADVSNESYTQVAENNYRIAKDQPLSTISVDVDRASYSNVRRFLNQGQKPPADAVRIEEMINYFNYTYPQPDRKDPIAIVTELSECPWNKDHKLLHIGLQARTVDVKNLPPSNLVFLIDVSGSMGMPNKLPLVKASMKLLVDQLRAEDRVSIVVYAGNAGQVLPPTKGTDRQTIISAIDNLEAGGSTAGGQGIQLAYKIASEQFLNKGNNRIILATDGDFNVGMSSDKDMEALITQEREKGIFLTCLGYGMGNYKDSKLETLADKGNGNYAYVDNIQEARKMLVSEFGGTLFTIAKDVKTQIEFNPAKVHGYRLIGYENRVLKTQDFKDDKKDAAEMGSGHSVTILYEIIPAGTKISKAADGELLKYQQVVTEPVVTNSDELATIKFRYKEPDGATSKELSHIIGSKTTSLANTTQNFRFSASVAMFGMLLRESPYKGDAQYERAIALAENAHEDDAEGLKAEYLRIIKSVK